jgi:hypothetical protein
MPHHQLIFYLLAHVIFFEKAIVFSKLLSGNKIKNFSSPNREIKSLFLPHSVNNRPKYLNTFSPFEWPYLSLILLKKSISITSIDSAFLVLENCDNMGIDRGLIYLLFKRPVNSSIDASFFNSRACSSKFSRA